jgi:hypothetical protein
MKKIVRLTESDLVRLVNRVLNEQDRGGFKEPVSNETGNDFDHFNKIVKPKLLAAGFKHDYDKGLEQYGKSNSMIYGDHNTGVNVLLNMSRTEPSSYIVWVGSNKGKKTFPLGGTNNDSKVVANKVVNYALSLKR